ncbi:SsrA-binding protein SmpB [Blattabacterium cuenoti]|uniref:SsrA-binding protein SmpB n=1 Tax=Blattabacterium cuenoti TaxID=1653831 RepID=UPI00163C0923|nr:SsrA-binding protein SmpB [Blattabacterium cuenoti]
MSIINRKAKYKFHLYNYYIAGIQLLGSEVKSIRKNKVNISESFCQIKNGELYSINMYIEKYEFVFDPNYSTNRDRKLLLNKNELLKINKKLLNPGITIIPIEIFFNKNGYAKMKIAIAKGKKNHDKRESIKKRESIRDVKRYFI